MPRAIEIKLAYDRVGGSYPWEVYQRVTTEKRAQKLVRLADAAPELLAACKAALETYYGKPDPAVVKQLEDAIAKATG